MEVGNRVEIGWGKMSFCYIEYFGNDRFYVRRSIHTKLEAGDTFHCKLFEVGQPAQLTHLNTKEDKDLILVLGQKEGLKNIQVITKKDTNI